MELFSPGTKIKYLIHCAANIEPLTPILAISHQELSKNLAVNVIAPVYLTNLLKSYFSSTTRVLFVGSDYVGTETKFKPNISGSYSMSKTALKNAVDYLRLETKGKMLVGYLNPGPTQTATFFNFWQAVNAKTAIRLASTPADPKDVANFITQVLEKADDRTYVDTNWDYRHLNHHQADERSNMPIAKL